VDSSVRLIAHGGRCAIPRKQVERSGERRDDRTVRSERGVIARGRALSAGRSQAADFISLGISEPFQSWDDASRKTLVVVIKLCHYQNFNVPPRRPFENFAGIASRP